MNTARSLRVGFVMEQALGHVTYAQNLARAYDAAPRIAPIWLPVPFDDGGLLDRLPVTKANWAARGSVRAYGVARPYADPKRVDALFFHTQTIALAAPLFARSIPVIVSLDATPLNYDSVGTQYGHVARAGSAFERAKQVLYRRVFHSAAALTTWSEWAKRSLCDDYGVDPRRITVVAPGVDLELFRFGSAPCDVSSDGRLRILFVGGDFQRKGGPLLLQAMRDGLAQHCELDIVTSHDVPDQPGVHVHRGLGPNDPRLLDLYRSADVFALPTHADCLAVVLAEAMASGLPVVTTSVAAQPEAVADGKSGIVVEPGDTAALGRALLRLARDPALRHAMGREGRAIAECRFDARRNANRIADVITTGVERWRRGRDHSKSVLHRASGVASAAEGNKAWMS